MTEWLAKLLPWYDTHEAEKREQHSIALAKRADRVLDRAELATESYRRQNARLRR